MQLNVRTWGTGPRTALLVHGLSDDAGTWWRVGPALADRGFTVLAPDLRGHGRSCRSEHYAFAAFADDLVDTLPVQADLALGHSLGAIVLGLAAERLQPRRAVFVDPSWLRARGEVPLGGPLATTRAELGPETSAWSPEEVAADLGSNALLDPRVIAQLLETLAPDERLVPPPAPTPGALVIVPELAPLLPPEAHPVVASLGYEIRTVPGVRHVVHRDDFDAFMTVLRSYLDKDGGLAA
jgi:pimeloyl-ACP methyl ester carboxylesterase